MNTTVYNYRFESGVPLGEAESTLARAIVAAEALHGSANVRLGTRYSINEPHHACVIEARHKAGGTVARIFTGFLIHEFGEDSFKVSREEGASSACSCAKAGQARACACACAAKADGKGVQCRGSCGKAGQACACACAAKTASKEVP